MDSRSQLGDEQNTSFGPANRPMQDRKPGFGYGGREPEVAQEDHHVRRRSGEEDIPRAPLAERIRERQGE